MVGSAGQVRIPTTPEVNPEEGPRWPALGDKMMVLMNRRVTVAHQSHRSYIPLRLFVSQRQFQRLAELSGEIDPLSQGDVDAGSSDDGMTTGHACLEHWTVRLQKDNRLPPRPRPEDV